MTYTGITLTDALRMVGPGWSELVKRAYDAKPEHVTIVDVKEKLGGLTIYTWYAPPSYDDLLHALMNESYSICESCGKPGELRTQGWYKTLCDGCAGEGVGG